MKSIRTSLIVGSVAGTLALLGVTGVVVYRGAQSILVRQLDEGLADRAGNCAAVTKQTPEGFEFEIEDIHMPEFTTAGGTGYLEVWAAGDTVLFRSPKLVARDIAGVSAGATGHPAFGWIQAPDGKRVRAVELRTHAVVDPDDWEEAGLPMPEAVPMRCVVALEANAIDAFLSRLRAFLIALGAVSSATAALVLAFVVRNSLRPLGRLAAEIAALNDTDLAARVSLTGAPLEMAPVVEQLNEWLARLERAFERERTFSADVAHELRTPLAGLRSTLEVAMAHPRDETAYRQTCAELLAIIRRLQNMVETLLYLGRLESGHVNIERVDIDMSEFVAMTWESFEDKARRSELDVTRELPEGIVVAADPVLLEVAVRNLFDNAATYTDQGGSIRIAVAWEADRGVLRVANSGSQVPARDVEMLTRHFARIDPARKESGEHFGLGLALVRKIADALGGSLEISSHEGGEFVAILALRR